MSGFLKYNSCAILMVPNLLAKYTYLKIGEGGGAQAYAFKSKQACETARQKHITDWNRMITKLKKQTKSGGTFAAAPRAKCLDSLPLGFVRPRTDKN
jgi:hypothetical protein